MRELYAAVSEQHLESYSQHLLSNYANTLLVDLLFLSSSRWSVVTAVSRSKRSIHRAAPDPGCAVLYASLTRASSLGPPSIAAVIDIGLLRLNKKSDMVQ